MKCFSCYRRPGAAGFTLIELLAVIVIIAMLLGIATTAAQWVFKIARVKRYEMTCRVFETAISRYRHEYKEWPIPESKYKSGTYVYTFPDKENKECLSMLRAGKGNKDNPNGTNFLDESGLFVDIGRGKVIKMVPLIAAGPDAYPFVYRNRNNNVSYYSVTIDVEAETVKVQ